MSEFAPEDVRILLVEDDQGLSSLLCDEIENGGYQCRVAHDAETALSQATEWLPDLIVSDLRLPGADGLALLARVRQEMPDNAPDFLMITAFGTVSKAVESLKAGAEDFLTKPLDLEHFKLSIERVLEKRRLREQLSRYQRLDEDEAIFHGLYGRSRCMQVLFQQIRQVAKATGSVLILGESGTGKELVAKAVHDESGNSQGPFLVVNCAGIPEHLLESEFFGHEAGAFTGASAARQGIFAEAEGGTLLLDEISEMPLLLQGKLLRMLQDGKIRPVGSNREQQVKVRILAATNQDLDEQVRAGTFREDLFYRLNTFSLRIPPLREREDDIDLLCAIFLKKFAAASSKRMDGFSKQAHGLLRCYPFPGNVRELQSAIERAVAFCQGREVQPQHLPRRVRQGAGMGASAIGGSGFFGVDEGNGELPTLSEVEQKYIRYVLGKVDGNKRQAATILGIARRTLYRRLEELELSE